jgi:hypothetical protein
MKIAIWTEETAKNILARKLSFAKRSRVPQENVWTLNEQATFKASSTFQGSVTTVDSGLFPQQAPSDNSTEGITVNYILKNIRFIHAQMSANPPSTVPKPNSADPADRRAADAADRVCRYAMRQYSLQDYQDRVSLMALIYGTAISKVFWNPSIGDIASYDEQSGKIEMEGDHSFCLPSIWDIYPDPDAREWNKVQYVFEKVLLPYEEALAMFPDKKEELEKIRQKEAVLDTDESSSSLEEQTAYDSVIVYQYWEKGSPFNGFLGRFVWCLDDGTPLSDPASPSPQTFSSVLKDGSAGPPKAELPYYILTDIDVPNSYWGRSVVTYAAGIQEMINRLDNLQLDILEAHGIPRLLVPEGALSSATGLSNSAWQVTEYTGQIPPNFMEALPLPPGIMQTRDRLMAGLNEAMGINESMQGQMSRETPASGLQYATQQGNMIRRRLFNKLVFFVEWTYSTYLAIVREKWTESRTVRVVGTEKAFESADLKGADVHKGYSFVSEFGASLSLDPMARRQEILTLMPLFEKAGMEPRKMLGFLKLNELDSAFDAVQMGADRQREIFEEIMLKGEYVIPRDLQDHKRMLDYAYNFVMTSEFRVLPEGIKGMIERHIKAREQLAAVTPTAEVPNTPGAPVEAPV